MTKKSRRARQRAAQTVQPVRISQPRRSLSSQPVVKEVNFAQEYHYVIEDLKRIAITAAALLVLLVALAILIG
jgi:hypothetical protein